MATMQVEKSDEGSKRTLKFSGSINEDSSFNDQDLEGSPEIILDLEEVTEINSCGVREWTKWINSAEESISITFINCPKIIINQINMVTGFLPKNARVDSLFVPYYAPDSGNEKMILFKRGTEFSEGKISPPEVKDEDGEEMEMDVFEEKYFRFLSR